jgi:hypothetical protein
MDLFSGLLLKLIPFDGADLQIGSAPAFFRSIVCSQVIKYDALILTEIPQTLWLRPAAGAAGLPIRPLAR